MLGFVPKRGTSGSLTRRPTSYSSSIDHRARPKTVDVGNPSCIIILLHSFESIQHIYMSACLGFCAPSKSLSPPPDLWRSIYSGTISADMLQNAHDHQRLDYAVRHQQAQAMPQ